jgi:hypothetical protein
MTSQYSPYLPIPPELAESGQLVLIKQAADSHECSAATLKNNAKARNLRAFQEFHGAPVFVLLSDVEEFLKSRPDIASVFRPKAPAVTGIVDPWNLGGQSFHSSPFQEPVAASTAPLTLTLPDGEVSMIRLKSLDYATPAERSFAAKVIFEIFALISQSIPPTPPPPTQNITK